jgi:hypothetical protein
VEEGLSLKDKVSFVLVLLADACISEMAFNAAFAEFAEVTDSHTNNAKVLHETFVVKVTGSCPNNTKALHETFVVKVTDSHANNAKMLHETFFVEVTDSNPV